MQFHPTAIIEKGVNIGPGTRVWDNVHLRGPSQIGRDCIIGEKSYVAYGVSIGNRVKINAFVYICNGVTIEDGVMISAGTVFTNDRYPRATSTDLQSLKDSDPDENTRPTRVARGATVGANAVIGCGITLGEFSMVGMGAVVTRDISPFHLVAGNPAQTISLVCRCGQPFYRTEKKDSALPEITKATCTKCHLEYKVSKGLVTELSSSSKEIVL